MKTNLICRITVSALALQLLSVPVWAGMLEEVVVTARKRQESLQETPVAVTAMSSEDLRAANIRDLGDLTRVVPGLATRNGDKYAAFSIRGVGSRGTKTVSTDPAVGVYVDGIFIPRSDSQLLEVISAESVQVLRGPQGTLFGKNTAGGALLVTSSKPRDEFAGEFATDIGNLDRFNISGNLNVPLTQNLFARFTVDSRERDGYMEDVGSGLDYGNDNKIAWATQLRWLVNDDMTADLLAFYSRQDENAAPQTCRIARLGTVLQALVAPGDSRLYPEACADSTALEKDGKVEMDRTGVPWEMESTMLGLTVDREFNGFSLRSITGYLAQQDIANFRDQDASTLFGITNLQLVIEQMQLNGLDADEEREFLSQEIQLTGIAFDDRLNYTVGAFYSDEDIDNNPSGNMLSDAGFLGQVVGDNISVLPPQVAGFRVSALTDYDNETWAVFAQTTWHFDDSWSLTAGGRYGEEDKEAVQRNYLTTESSPGLVSRSQFDALRGTVHELAPAPDIPIRQGNENWDDFTPMVSLDYVGGDAFTEATGLDAFMVYGTWSQGFKAGGFTAFGDDFLAFEPEHVTNYEMGIKLDGWNNRIRFNAALYYMEYDDMQIVVTRQLSELQTAVAIANAGEATMAGAEAELSIVPNAHWSFHFSASYIDAEYDEFNDIIRDPASGEFVPIDRSHEDFAYMPTTTYSWSGQYSWYLDIGEISARLAGSYKDEIYIGLEGFADQSPLSVLDDYTLWQARVTWRFQGEHDIRISAYVDNLTDAAYYGTGNLQWSSQGTVTLVRGLERTYGVQATYHF